jgi:hypothetical protein
MIVRPHKILMIKKNFIEFSFNDNEPNYNKFKSLNSAEQYFLAENYNWDDGVTVLKWIVDSKKCDKGTACMIFWSAEPDFYFDYTVDTIEEYEKDVWELLQKIIKRFKANDFYQSKFEFIPENQGYKTDWKTELEIWNLPKDLKKGIKGKRPFTFGF